MRLPQIIMPSMTAPYIVAVTVKGVSEILPEGRPVLVQPCEREGISSWPRIIGLRCSVLKHALVQCDVESSNHIITPSGWCRLAFSADSCSRGWSLGEKSQGFKRSVRASCTDSEHRRPAVAGRRSREW